MFVSDLPNIANLAQLLCESESPDTDFLMNLEIKDDGSGNVSSSDDGYNSGDGMCFDALTFCTYF